MKIYYDDPAITVCEKPAGVLSQEGEGRTLPRLLTEETGHTVYYPVHRLDAQTAGLMVFAKTQSSAAALSESIRKGEFRKEYLCLVHGRPETDDGVYEDLLFRDASRNKTYVVDRARRGVKPAKLSFRVLETRETPYGSASLLRIRLFTGRTHQIRVQLSSRGMPLLGDGKYGAKDHCPFLALYACRLSFPHPVTGEEMTFEDKPRWETAV